MIKNRLLKIVFFLLFPLCSSATNYVVSGSDVMMLNGLYKESGTYNNKPLYRNTTTITYDAAYLYYDGTKWQICLGLYFFQDNYYTNISTNDTPPLSGWINGWLTYGRPIANVRMETKALAYSRKLFIEDHTNGGFSNDTVKISYNKFSGDIFSGTNGDDFITDKVVVTNVPSGMNAHVIRLNDSVAAFIFTGNASSHINENDVNNLTIKFLPNAFISNDTVGMVDAFQKNLQVNFREVFTVGTSGTEDFSTIKEAIAGVTPFDILLLSAEVFTEFDINVNKALVFIGQGADKTIVQAHEEKNQASGRVFSVGANSQEPVYFEQMTIRNGRVIGSNAYGGGIFSYNNLEMHGCVVRDNIAISGDNYQALGGGIRTQGLKMYNCLIADNYLSNAINDGQILGGGIYCTSSFIVNTTISGNYSSGLGGGLHPGIATIINCTLSNNFSKTYGGGMFVSDKVILLNTIISDNQATNETSSDLGSYGQIYASNSIISKGARVGDYNIVVPLYTTESNIYTIDPMLGPLADNGGATLTYALLPGSPAIDAGIYGLNIPMSDQRGYVVSNQKDIGAFEYTGITTAISSKNMTSAIDVYPNPSKGLFYTPDVTGSITVSNLLGKQVTERTVEQGILDLTDLPKGMYLLTITNSSNTKKSVKIIIE